MYFKYIALCKTYFVLLAISFITYLPLFSQENVDSTALSNNLNPELKEIFNRIKMDIGDARVVLLGEINHADGNVFEMQTELVKLLHENMGFNILAFESGFYDLYKAQQEIDSGETVFEALDNSIYPLWSQSKEFQPLVEYLEANKHLKIAGFDLQLSGEYSTEYLTYELEDFISNYIERVPVDFEIYDKVLMHMSDMFYFPGTVDYKAYVKNTNRIIKALERILKEQEEPGINKQAAFWKQCVTSTAALAKFLYVDEPSSISEEEFEANDNNPRDKQMAENLLFLVEQNPNEKIICWGASAHFAAYTEELDEEELQEFIPMGRYIKESLKEEAFSIAFNTSGGTYGYIGQRVADTVPTPPENSIEYELMMRNKDHIWVNLKDEYDETLIVSTAIEFTPVQGNWSKVFDAFFFIKNITPAHLYSPPEEDDKAISEQEQFENIDFSKLDSISRMGVQSELVLKNYRFINESFQKINGQILDEKSGEPIPYAGVQLGKTTIGTSANQYGIFSIKIPIKMRWDTLWVSSMGYKKHGTNLEGKKSETLKINLHRETIDLSMVNIYAEKLTAKDIMKKAIEAKSDNYDMKSYSSSFYIKDYLIINDTNYVNTELAGEFIRSVPRDSSISGHIYNERRANIEIKERPITHGLFDNPLLSGLVGSYYDPVRRHPMFTLKRMRNFIFKLDTILKFNDRDIYQISFKAKKNNFSNIQTFYADAFYGVIYIDENNYAIIKGEINIDYDPYGWVKAEQTMTKRKNIPSTNFKNFAHNKFTEKSIFIYEQKENNLYYSVYIFGATIIDETDLKTNDNYIYNRLNYRYYYNYQKGRKPAPKDYEMNWLKPEIPYNPEFWNNFVAPVGDEVKALEELKTDNN